MDTVNSLHNQFVTGKSQKSDNHPTINGNPTICRQANSQSVKSQTGELVDFADWMIRGLVNLSKCLTENLE